MWCSPSSSFLSFFHHPQWGKPNIYLPRCLPKNSPTFFSYHERRILRCVLCFCLRGRFFFPRYTEIDRYIRIYCSDAARSQECNALLLLLFPLRMFFLCVHWCWLVEWRSLDRPTTIWVEWLVEDKSEKKEDFDPACEKAVRLNRFFSRDLIFWFAQTLY